MRRGERVETLSNVDRLKKNYIIKFSKINGKDYFHNFRSRYPIETAQFCQTTIAADLRFELKDAKRGQG